MHPVFAANMSNEQLSLAINNLLQAFMACSVSLRHCFNVQKVDHGGIFITCCTDLHNYACMMGIPLCPTSTLINLLGFFTMFIKIGMGHCGLLEVVHLTDLDVQNSIQTQHSEALPNPNLSTYIFIIDTFPASFFTGLSPTTVTFSFDPHPVGRYETHGGQCSITT